MAIDFFPQKPKVQPLIYVYKVLGVQSHEKYIKVGYTVRDAKTRIKEQMGASQIPFEILYQESAVREDGSIFTDKDVHTILDRKGFQKLPLNDSTEWYKCTVNDVRSAIVELKTGIQTDDNRTQTFAMRPEQYRAVEQTINYFKDAKKDEPTKAPKFLWNAKMRFGKTFASYQLAKKNGI